MNYLRWEIQGKFEVDDVSKCRIFEYFKTEIQGTRNVQTPANIFLLAPSQKIPTRVQKLRFALWNLLLFSSSSVEVIINTYNILHGRSTTVAAEGYSCRKTQWVFLRSRLPRER